MCMYSLKTLNINNQIVIPTGAVKGWVVSVDFCEATPEQEVPKVKGMLRGSQGKIEAPSGKEPANPGSCQG